MFNFHSSNNTEISIGGMIRPVRTFQLNFHVYRENNDDCHLRPLTLPRNVLSNLDSALNDFHNSLLENIDELVQMNELNYSAQFYTHVPPYNLRSARHP